MALTFSCLFPIPAWTTSYLLFAIWDGIFPVGFVSTAFYSQYTVVTWSSDTISIVGANNSIPTGLTLVRSVNSPLATSAPGHTKDAVWVYNPDKDRHRPLNEYLGKLALATDGLPYPCRACGELNRPMYKKDIYVVVRGFELGIVQGLVGYISLRTECVR
jgi:hypothetical protein